MPYAPREFNSVPNGPQGRSGLTIALIVALVGCLGCACLGGLGTVFAMRSTTGLVPTIRAGVEGTLTATAGQGLPVANNRPPPSLPANLTPRPTNTLGPTATPRQTATPTATRPTSTPLPKPTVTSQQIGYYRDTWGELWFMGELVNSGAIDAGDLRISVELIGAQGQVVAGGRLDATAIGVVALKPGQKTVWQVKIAQAPRQWQTERIEATTGPVVVGRGQSPYLGVVAADVRFQVEPGPFQRVVASGLIRNDGLATVRGGRLRVAVYDDAGKLTRVIEGWPEFADVTVGNTVPFRVELRELTAPPAHFALFFTDLR